MRASLFVLAAAVAATNATSIRPGSSALPQATSLRVTAASNDNGAAVVLGEVADVDGTSIAQANFGFKSTSVPTQITFFGGSKCADVTDGIKADGTKVQIWDCDANNSNQQWISQPSGPFVLAGTDFCLDVTDGNYNTGNQLQIWTCDQFNQNQHFGQS